MSVHPDFLGAATAAWIPFIVPMHGLQPYWFLLLVPLAFGIAVIYKALRMDDLSRFWRKAGVTTIAIVGGVVALGLIFAILVEWIIPMIPVTTVP